MSETIVRSNSLTKVYLSGAQEVHPLRGVDFQVARGEFIVMPGPAGSGKSTFLSIVGELDTTTAGEQGSRITSRPRWMSADRRNTGAFVWQRLLARHVPYPASA